MFSLIALPVASADDGGHNPEPPVENELHFTSYPQLYINASTNASFNVSYAGMILFNQNGFYYSYFPSEKWSVHRVSNNSVYYTANIVFHNANSNYLNGFEHQFNISNGLIQGGQDGFESEQGHQLASSVTIWMNKTTVPNPVQSNTTNLTSFEITFLMNSNSITGSGDLFLIQQLGARLSNVYEQYHHLAQVSNNLTYINDTGVGVTSTNYDAYYWWDSNYTLNGNNMTINASRSIDGNVDTLIFQYKFTNGISHLSQDPYFSVPQVNLFSTPILQKDIQSAANFIILHAELLAAGFGSGIALLGISYGTYRKRKF